MPEMRALTIRLPETLRLLAAEEAKITRVSVAELIREALLVRIIWGRSMRGESVYAIAAQAVAAARETQGDEVGEATYQTLQVVEAVRDLAPREMDALLKRLDG